MAKRVTKKKGGRPALKPEDRRLPPMGFRPTLDLRGKLDQASAESGKSLSQEIESRLERSFLSDSANERVIEAAFADKTTYRLMVMLATAKSLAEEETGKSTFKDWETQYAFMQASEMLLYTFGAKPPDGWWEKHAPPEPKFKATGLMGPLEYDESYLEKLEKYEPLPDLGEQIAAAMVLSVRKAASKPKAKE